MKKIIYLDLDGVLVDFVSGALKEIGVTEYSIPQNEYNIENWGGVNISTEDFWLAIDKTNEHFWANLEKFSWADDLVELCQDFGEVFFLSSPSRNPYCVAGKMLWIQKHYPKLVRNVILTGKKHHCSAKGRVLIDDSPHKVTPFLKYGGEGILFPAAYNLVGEVDDVIDYIEKKLISWKNGLVST